MDATTRKRLLLVNPSCAADYLNSGYANRALGKAAYFPSLSIATVAALTPGSLFEVDILDETLGADCLTRDLSRFDLVGVTAFDPNHTRALEIGHAVRRLGKPAVIGGPYITSNYHKLRDCPFTAVFLGETEYTWPRFCREFREGRHQAVYRETGTVDLNDSPVPRWDLVPLARYLTGLVQTSRGCPFKCDFCDAIVLYGNKMRTKRIEQVIREIAICYDAGLTSIFLADDNFTADRRYVKQLLRAIIAWRQQRNREFTFGTQMSIDASKDRELLTLLRQAGVTACYVGIESPNREVLRNIRKYQNAKLDMVRAIAEFHAYGLNVLSGLIFGFDENDASSFEEAWRFCQDIAIPTMLPYVLSAPEGTPLRSRLEREGRILDSDGETTTIGSLFRTNIVFKNLSPEEFERGFTWFADKVFDDDGFVERVRKKFAGFNTRGIETAGVHRFWREIPTLYRMLVFALLHPRASAPLVRVLRRLWPVLRRHPESVGDVIADLLIRSRFQTYYQEQGYGGRQTVSGDGAGIVTASRWDAADTPRDQPAA